MSIVRNTPPKGRMLIAVALLVVFLFSWQIITLIADWLWFQELGYTAVFTVSLLAQAQAAALFAVLFFMVLFLNLFLAARLSSGGGNTPPGNVFRLPVAPMSSAGLIRSGFFVLLVLSVFAALFGASQGENLLRFRNGLPFQIQDPLFHRDIAFYVFQLPFLKQVYGWVMMVFLLSLLLTAVVYLIRGAFTLVPPKGFYATAAARRHLFLLVALLFFLSSGGFWLDLFDLPFIKRGVVYGAGYTDVTTQIWVLYALSILSALAGLSFLFLMFKRDWRIPALVVVAFLLVLVAGRTFYPTFIQKFVVIPNEVVLEKPYLEHNIRYTRQAYGLNNIEDRDFPALDDLTMKDIRNNNATIRNIRLWDYAPLLQSYGQLQEIRTYYKFLGVDNDRYTVAGEYRQVMLSPRELSSAALPSRTWVNEHLTYTHGYGAVMSPVNRISQEGMPEFFIQDIPPKHNTDIRISRPEIYYGESSNEYVFVMTKRPEFDYPVGDKNVYTTYSGKGGVPLSFLKKILFALRFQSLTILLSDDITSTSRIMYHRSIKERVSRVAPFAVMDPDPYLVVSPEGRLVWLLDGYTVTDRYPYSEPTPRIGNYIRNSLKAVVDAYDGTVQLYISDARDPIIQTYARIFPGVLRTMEEMPQGLRSHVRYPPGMFSLQARMYQTYHMQDPQVFYNKEDLWTIPQAASGGAEQEMRPYYTIMRLPEEKKEEYILLLPFTPSKRDNMSAWLAARCDAPHYGKLIVYNFPKQRLVYGPRQIIARINQDPYISQQLSLWNQRGSRVVQGSLLAIPIEKSILYVQSVFLASEKGQLPELKRIIVAFGNTIVMEETLETALQRVFGDERPREASSSAPVTSPGAPPGLASSPTGRQVAEALTHYRKAQDMLRQGNWGGYGEELKKMEAILTTLEKSAR